MTRTTDRRVLLASAGGAAFLAATTGLSSASGGLQGTVEFEGGAKIPEGRLVVSLDIPDLATGTRAAQPRLDMTSDGAAKVLGFTLPARSDAIGQGGEIVATLERADGWLLARGSASVAAKEPLRITLYKVMY